MSLNGKVINGVLLDITGVLVESSTSGPKAIPGSVEAVKKLEDAGIPVRFVTVTYPNDTISFLDINLRNNFQNETQRTRSSLVQMLHSNGYSMNESKM